MESTVSCPTDRRSGFTLIEMSIVLVIIGLLAAGILVGRDLIRAAEIRDAIGDIDKYSAAVHAFQMKYNCLPGDCSDAVSLLGASNNGNGNGYIDYGYEQEVYGFWQHLALARLIPGNYTGEQGPDALWQHVAGVNAPASSIAGAVFAAVWEFSSATNPTCYYQQDYNHALLLGSSTVGDGSYGWPYYPALDGSQALAIDTKMDDGKPGTGEVIASMKPSCWLGATCTTSDVEAEALYNLSGSMARCALFINKRY